MRTLISSVIVSLLLFMQPAVAQNFSVDVGHPDIGGGFPPPEDVLAPGGAGPPFPVIPGGAPGIDVDAFSFGHFAPPTPNTPVFPIVSVDFSVDIFAVGAAGSAVAAEAFAADAETDVFRSGLGGGNVLLHDGDGSVPSLGPALGIAEGAGFPGPTPEGVDAYDSQRFVNQGVPMFWSVDAGSLVGPYLGASAADVFVAPAGPGYAAGPFVVYAAAAGPGGLGLAAADELDALEVYDLGVMGTFDGPDVVLYSLAPGSPSLLPGGALAGAGPGDVFISPFGGAPGVFIPAPALGLVGVGGGAMPDNLNALSVTVPEPGSMAMIGLVVGGLMTQRRRSC